MSENNANNPNHPQKGSATKVEPIKDLKAIKRIKKLREDNPRDYCLFTMGINTAFRACELLSIKVGQVNYLRAGDELSLKQSKNKKYRSVTVNGAVVRAVDLWLKYHPCPGNDDALCLSHERGIKRSLSRRSTTWSRHGVRKLA
jgi:integrase